jgi:hypothetical protein
MSQTATAGETVLRIRDVYPGSGSDHFLSSRIPDPDPGSFIEKERCKISLLFFLPDQMITVVNDHRKFNFSSFSIFFKGINFTIYQFHYLKFNFWSCLGSGIRDPEKKSSRILGVKKHRIPDPDPQHRVEEYVQTKVAKILIS